MKTYTQQELEEMVDADLNKTAGILSGTVRADCNYSYYKTFCPDYCRNWGAAGALVDECGISVEFDCEIHDDHPQSWWNASLLDRVVTMHHRNPRRAVTIVYILIKQGQ